MRQLGPIAVCVVLFIMTVGVTGPGPVANDAPVRLAQVGSGGAAALAASIRGETDALEKRGRAMHADGDFDGAVAAFAKALWERPNNAHLHFQLAEALEARGNHLSALRAYHDAVEFAPANAEYRRRLDAFMQGPTVRASVVQ